MTFDVTSWASQLSTLT